MNSGNWKKYLAVAGGVAGVSALFYYLLSDEDSVGKPSKQFTEAQIFEIMKYLKGQLYTVWIQVADIRNKVVAENNNNTVMQNGQNIRDIIGEQTSKLVSQKQNLVCIKYEISQEDLQKYVDHIYSNNKDIQSISTSIRECFSNAIDGVKPEFNLSGEVIEALPQEKVLYLYERILRECGDSLVQLYKRMKDEGESDFSLSNQTFVRNVKGLELGKLKTKILKESGVEFPKEPESPTSILTKIRYKYQQENDNFNEKVTSLDKKYEELMDKLTVPQNQKQNEQDISEEDVTTVQYNNDSKTVDPELCEKIFGSQESFNEKYSQFTSSIQSQENQEQKQQQ